MVRPGSSVLVLAILLISAASALATEPPLPPAPPWDGASRALVVAADDPWITPAEASGLRRTPDYEATFAWLRRLVTASPELAMTSFGKSGEGRDLWLVIASADRVFTPAGLRRTGKPIVLVQAGIHSGEIDGKDAGMMLLRDMTVRGTKRSVLEAVQWLFVPILSVDGHERSSPYSRINQRGPESMGWRTNARNLNLNRDYSKADTPEMQALLGLLNRWQPDLYVDVHVTDGIDYQYDVTWGSNGFAGYSPSIAKWLDSVLNPALRRDLEAMGHIPGPLVFAANRRNIAEGIFLWTAPPRFSNGYGDARHLPTVLVENHSLKPFDQRVLGTYVFLESLFVTVGRHLDGLRQATREDRARRRAELPLIWEVPESEPPALIDFLGIEQRLEPSEISGAEKVVWTGRPVAMKVPVLAFSRVTTKVRRPAAYWISPVWTEVIERLALHGIEMERLSAPREIEVEMYRLEDVELDDEAYEGHLRVTATPVAQRRRETFPAGSVRVPTDQPLGDLAVLLLEPSSPDSFFQWGFFLEILQRTEYFEAYVMEPIAERMLAEDEELRAEFAKRLEEDAEFAADPRARLEFFYRRTPYFDARWRLYPVGRE